MFEDLLKVSSKMLVCSVLELFNCVKLKPSQHTFCLPGTEGEHVVSMFKLEAPEEENWEN